MIIKIIKYSNDIYWYKDYVGKLFNVDKLSNGSYVVIDKKHKGFTILKEDGIDILRQKKLERILDEL